MGGPSKTNPALGGERALHHATVTRMPRGRAGADVAFWESNTLDEHVALIKRQVERSLDDPELGDVVERVVTNTTSKLGVFKAWGTVLQLPKEEPCEAKDHDALVLTRIWNFVILNWSYIEDPEGFDLFASIRFNMNAKEHAAELQRLLAEDEASSDGLDESARQLVRGHIARLRAVKTSGAGDCDDATVVFGALCKRAGFSTVRARVISVDGEAFGHVYPVVGLPRKYPTELVPLDPTVRNAVPGWEYEGGKVVQDFDL